MSLAGAATTGDKLETLRAMRDDLAGRMDDCTSDQNFAVMGRLLTDVLGQIEAAEKAGPEQKGTALDELAAKRNGKAPRGADASRKSHPAGKAKRG